MGRAGATPSCAVPGTRDVRAQLFGGMKRCPEDRTRAQAGTWVAAGREGAKLVVHRRAVAPAFLLLSLRVVTASLLASPSLNCPFVGLGLGVDARLALLM